MSLFLFSSRRRHTRSFGDWSSDVCSSDLHRVGFGQSLAGHAVVGPGLVCPALGRNGLHDGWDHRPAARDLLRRTRRHLRLQRTATPRGSPPGRPRGGRALGHGRADAPGRAVSSQPLRWVSRDGVLFRCHGALSYRGSGAADPWGGGAGASTRCGHGARALVEGRSHPNGGRDGARGSVAESGPDGPRTDSVGETRVPMSLIKRTPTRRVAVIGAGLSLFMRRALETGKELSYYAASQALETSG